MLIILIILIIVMPVSVKEWINLHNPEILPHYWMYYILLFCVSYVLNGVVNSAYHAVTERIEVSAAQKRKSKEEKYVQDLFDSLTLGERAYLAFAVAANKCCDDDAMIICGCMARLKKNNSDLHDLLVDYYVVGMTFMSLAGKHCCSDGYIGKRLQKAEGIIEGMLMALDIRLEMDIVVNNSN